MENEIKIISDFNNNISNTISIEKNGVKEQVLNVSCSLVADSVSNIQTYVINKDLFLENHEKISLEIEKFKETVMSEAKRINCFVF